jgi:hypothetical protein
MIIDEGFLSNAKNIASTQTQNSEANVPVIRRENWEYEFSISFDSLENKEIDIELEKRYLLSCTIFREYGNVESKVIEKTKKEIYFGADMFITIDTIYELIRKIVYSTNNHAYILIKIKKYDGNYNRNLFFVSNNLLLKIIKNGIGNIAICNMFDGLQELKTIFEQFGISERNIYRWLYRNETMIIDKSGQKNNIFPVKTDSYKKFFDILLNNNIIASAFKPTDKEYHIDEESKKSIIKTIKEEGINQFFMYYTDSFDNIIIQTMFPIKSSNEIIIPKFKLEKNNNLKEYIYLHCMMSDFKNNRFYMEDVHLINKYDLKDAHHENIIEGKERMTYIVYMEIFYKNKIYIINDDDDIIEELKIFGKHSYIESNDYNKIIFIAEMNVTPETVYEFIYTLKKRQLQVKLEANSGSNKISFETKYYNGIYLLRNDIKNHIYIRKTNVNTDMEELSCCSTFRNIMREFKIDERYAEKWMEEEKIVDIPIHDLMDSEYLFIIPTYIKNPDIIIKKMKMSYVLDPCTFKSYPVNSSLYKETNKTNEFIIFFSRKNKSKELCITLTSLYPVYYKDLKIYTYPYFVYLKSKEENDKDYEFFEKLRKRLSKYNLNSLTTKTSDIVFAKIDEQGNVK